MQSNAVLEEKEEVGEAFVSASYHSASSSSFDDAMVDKNKEEAERGNADAEEVV